jgi:putative transposase
VCLDTVEGMSDAGHVTRAMVFTLDVTPAQERLLQSYCGAARRAHNWVLAQVKDNLDTRTREREAGSRTRI